MGSNKNPKVVFHSLEIILESARVFGAACLPLDNVLTKLPKMASHTQGDIRETGIHLLAEICRALESQSRLQDVINNIKPTQRSTLTALLQKQPKPLPPTR